MKVQDSMIWLVRILAVVILLQSLYMKASADPDSVAMFTALAMEPWGRISTAILELIAIAMILNPGVSGIGAGIGLFLKAGAIFFHVTKLGIKVNGSSILFVYTCACFLLCAILSWIHRRQIITMLTENG